MSSLSDLVHQITQVKQSIERVDKTGIHPFFPLGPPARPEEIAAIATAPGCQLPRGLAALRQTCNGWPHFLRNLTQLSADQMAAGPLHDAAVETLRTNSETFGPVWEEIPLSQVLVFAVDPFEGDLFFFNPTQVRADGEVEVVWWYNGPVERQETIEDFFSMLFELFTRRLRILSGG